jgi:ribose transport system ATP-binding protein
MMSNQYDAMKPSGATILECRSIRKEFAGIVALSDVSLAVEKGEIHALVGQNGAGKSTLVKILTGVYQPDAGMIEIAGKPIRMRGPNDAEANGIVIVHQDQALVAQFDVTQNIFLGQERTRGAGILDFATMRAATQAALDRVGASFSPDVLVGDLTVAQREQVSIAAALMRDPRILILDEPTASLSEAESEQLFQVVRALRDDGVTIIYISHYLDEVLDLVDRITILRDGKLVATLPAKGTSRGDIIGMMVGRDISQLYPKEEVSIGEPILIVEGLSQGNALGGVDLTLRRGEILGLAGLVGAGRTELAMALIGALPRSAGTVTLHGKPSTPSSPRQAKKEGFALIPEDRRHEGLVLDMSVRDNLTLPNISRWSAFGLLDVRRENRDAAELVRRLAIQPPRIGQIARYLSGGNQQKIVIGRWLMGDAEVFIFDEPTTGVDVGSKVEIYRQMVELAKRGAAIIFISSDFEEIAGMCDRAAVMHKGKISKFLERPEIDAAALLFWASGNTAPSSGEVPGNAYSLLANDGRTDWTMTSLLTRWGTIAGMLVTLALIGVVAPHFFSPGNVFDLLKQGSVLGFIALGLTVVLIAGGFDMSAGAISQLATNLAAGALIGGMSAAIGILFGALAGLAAGMFNALLVLVFRMPPFVATLGTMFVAMGATLLYNGGQALTLANHPGFFFIGQGYVGPVPFVFILLIASTICLHGVLRRTRLGWRMYAVGQNLPAAQLRGVDQAPYAFASFAIGGLVLGVSGVVLASYSYGASALATGIDFLISALAASFLGSTLSRRRDLNVIGTVVIALFLASLSNGLILMGISSQALPAIQGIVLVMATAVGVVRRREIGQVTIF